MGSPDGRWGYFTEFTFALIPPLYHSVMKKKLATWDRDFATEGELEIAARINAQAGYEMPEGHDSYARI